MNSNDLNSSSDNPCNFKSINIAPHNTPKTTRHVQHIHSPDLPSNPSPHLDEIGWQKKVNGLQLSNPLEFSLESYVDILKNEKSITPEQVGHLHNIALESLMNYPEIDSFDEMTRMRVALSLYRKLGISTHEAPYENIYNTLVRDVYNTESPSILSQKLVRDGIITIGQAHYYEKAISIIYKHINNRENYNPSAQTNVEAMKYDLDSLISIINSDNTLPCDKRVQLISTVYIIKNSADYWDGYFSNNGNENEIQGRGGNPCIRCLFDYRGQILAADATGFLIFGGKLIITVGLASAAATAGLSVALTVIVAALGAAITSAGAASYFANGKCKTSCTKKKEVEVCDVCPPNVMFFDGANCYYGWYPKPVSTYAFMWDYGFYYQAIPPGNSCPDGNIGGPFNAGGHGWYDGGNCVWGWWEPGYEAFIYGSGFYVKPKCR